MKFKKLSSIVATIVITASLAAGCTNTKTETEGTKPEETNKLAALTVLCDSSEGWVRNFNPFIAGSYQFTKGFTHEYLMLFDDMNNNKEIPWLAEQVITETDNKTLTIKVRKGVKWSDGQDFNAEDVAYSFLITKENPKIDNNGDWGENGKFEDVKIVDDYTVQLVLKHPNRFNRNDVLFQKVMIPEHIWSKIEDPATYVYETPVVTGPFSVVKDFTPEMVVLGRNENYWKKDELKVDELRIPQFNGNDGALALLQSGAVDWAHIFIPNKDTTYVQGDQSRKTWYGKNDAVRIAFNYMTPNENNKKAFNNVDFRRALSMTVDRQGIIDAAAFGYLDAKVPSATGLPPALFGYENQAARTELEKYTKYDIDAAKALLDKAGIVDKDGDGFRDNPDGTPIKFDIVSPQGWTDWNDGAAISAEGMQKAGINATSKPMDLGQLQESWKSGEHDVLYTAYGKNSNIWKYYFDTIGDTSRVKTPTWWSITQTNYVNKDMSALIEKMPTANDEELKKLTDEVEMFFNENMINIPLFYNGNWFVYNDSRFTGWATEENPYGQPALCVDDMKLYQLLHLEPVQK